jgi:anti-anti-sigma factor
MTNRVRTTEVIQLPAGLDRRTERAFLRELEFAMNAERPAIVIDCSQLQSIDRSSMYLLLHCLEKAMKRNGDVRLAVSRGGREDLSALGLDRLFRTFDTNQQAVESFRRLTVFPSPFVASTLMSENAA